MLSDGFPQLSRNYRAVPEKHMIKEAWLSRIETDAQCFDADRHAQAAIASTLEARGKHVLFRQAICDYLDALSLDAYTAVLDPGCGTGIVARAIARRGDVKARITAIDSSPWLIEAAKHFACEERVAERIRFLTGEPHWVIGPRAQFDVVILHRLLNRVADPGLVLKEVRRVLRPAGRVVVFDGNHDSLARATNPPNGDEGADDLWPATQPLQERVMRAMPDLLAENGFRMEGARAYAVANTPCSFYTYIARRCD
jgi:ubiquinone/menaquinone biosynthesis C-methylase UbiE